MLIIRSNRTNWTTPSSLSTGSLCSLTSINKFTLLNLPINSRTAFSPISYRATGTNIFNRFEINLIVQFLVRLKEGTRATTNALNAAKKALSGSQWTTAYSFVSTVQELTGASASRCPSWGLWRWTILVICRRECSDMEVTDNSKNSWRFIVSSKSLWKPGTSQKPASFTETDLSKWQSWTRSSYSARTCT